MLVHEAEHVRLHLIELDHPCLESAADRHSVYYSPWRDDPRPLYGVLHGVHVFGRVLEFLGRLLATESRMRRGVVEKRFALVQAQVARGLEELRMYAPLTEVGREVAALAAERCEWAADRLPSGERQVASATVAAVEAQRKAQWKR
jgi:HEXXH motif-containing protein